MWKTILLCASLFGSAALGLLAAARWIEPAALPFAAAIGVSLVGVVLILAAPARDGSMDDEKALRAMAAPTIASAFAHTAPRLEALDDEDVPKSVSTLLGANGPQATLH